jgi:2-polyprenyl-3-methyl-5-hydroxy-6-metoxy-1,4-benzoquinol methylase
VGTIKSLSNNSSYNKFLDIGCGYGFFSKEAQAAGFDVISLELAQNERKIAKDLIKSDPIASSFEEFECPPESLAAILMSQILEHAFDVNGWIAKAHSLLAREGVVAIALPNYGSIFRKVMQEKEPYICPPAHLNFFSANSLSRLLENQGFKVEAVQWISRLPKSAFEKRLPRLGKPLLPVINAASTAVLQAIDAARLGMMINVYARKV